MTQTSDSGTPEQEPGEAQGRRVRGERVVVVTPEGMAVSGTTDPDGDERNPAELIEQPAKVMRIGSMIKQLLEEVRQAPLDEAGRARLAEIHDRSIKELEQGLAPELVEELERITLPFTDSANAPSDAELRIAQAQLVGWLEGLFHGIQTALFAQQMAARAQLEQMRRALPQGLAPGAMPGLPGMEEGPERQTGQYL
ncbi:MAG TPA: bacterial proteasome activator family protein [Kineosporiaceae bacterium]|nr:bacterial proteasome activator family protein [Kineosporiaceae bacterium]